MEMCRSHFAFLVFVWIEILLNPVAAISIPHTPLDFDSSNANSFSANPISNFTHVGAVDPAFRFMPIYQGTKLRPVPCLLNSVNVALQLALEDFEGPMFKSVFRLDSHPQVQIAIIPDEEGGSIPRKFAVWGLNIGIGLMIKHLDFQTAVFVLLYRGRDVARITYEVTGVPDSISTDLTNATPSVNQTLPLSNTTTWHLQTSTDTNTTGIDTVDPKNDPRLRVAFQLTGSVITIYDIFYAALDVLRDIAPYIRTGRLADTTTRIDAANLILSTQQNNPPRTTQNPPYFQVEWLLKAVAQTPAYMLEQRSFREVEMIIFVDEIKVGEVSIMRPRTGNALVPASGDVLTSWQIRTLRYEYSHKCC